MKFILTINGGMGKSVFATALCRGVRRLNPESRIYVVTGYPDVFSGIDSVDMAFAHGHEHYFYDKYVSDMDVEVMANEPYLVTNHIKQAEHVIQSWFSLYGIPYSGEMPEVSLNSRERTFFANKYSPKRKYIVMQTSGGPAGDGDLKYSWARDIPGDVVRAVVQKYSADYDIYHVRKENQIGYEGTIPVHEGYKGICWLLDNSHKRLLMDSFCQHAAAALRRPSTVLWVANSPKVFGYDMHDNILANRETRKGDLRGSFLSKYNIAGSLHEFPYNDESEIFDTERVMASLDAQ